MVYKLFPRSVDYIIIIMFSDLFRTWFLVNATYNSFRDQVGFCKMQGYDTVSRETSRGPSLFTSGAALFGVGLSGNQFDGRLCGMCISITESENLRQPTNHSLNAFTNGSVTSPFIAMIFDECTDPICTQNTTSFLDFDVYSPTPPVWAGNPQNVKWKAVPCPVYNKDDGIIVQHFLEYLICTPVTCNAHNPEHQGDGTLRSVWNPYYFSITIRNSRIPIATVQLNDEPLNYVKGSGWTFSGTYKYNTPFVLELQGFDGTRLLDILDFRAVMALPQLPEYRGGVLYESAHQI